MATRIHIVGCAPRSGTTLTFQLLTTCCDVAPFGEHELSIFVSPRTPPPVYCSKRPNDLVHVARLIDGDPNLWAIYVLRDPRDAVCSRHNRHPDRYWTDLVYWKRNDALVRPLKDHPRLVIVRYEDLATDPDAVQAALTTRMPFIGRRAAFSRFAEVAAPSGRAARTLGGTRAVDARSVSKWREHKPRLAAQLERHGPISQQLIDWGYETDDAWLAELDGVEPLREKSVQQMNSRGPRPAWRRMAERAARRAETFYHETRYRMGLNPRIDLDTPGETSADAPREAAS